MKRHPLLFLLTQTLAFAAIGCGSGNDGSGASPGAGSGGTGAMGGGGGDAASGGTGAGGSGPVTTSLTGKLGDLGAVKATTSSLMIENSGETLIYMSSAPITCDDLSISRWLGSLPADSQVVELVFKGTAALGTLKVPPAEVNYAKGGRSSAYEVSAASGSIVLTLAEPEQVVEGTVSATYDDGSSISGTFHAEYCDGGQGY